MWPQNENRILCITRGTSPSRKMQESETQCWTGPWQRLLLTFKTSGQMTFFSGSNGVFVDTAAKLLSCQRGLHSTQHRLWILGGNVRDVASRSKHTDSCAAWCKFERAESTLRLPIDFQTGWPGAKFAITATAPSTRSEGRHRGTPKCVCRYVAQHSSDKVLHSWQKLQHDEQLTLRQCIRYYSLFCNLFNSTLLWGKFIRICQWSFVNFVEHKVGPFSFGPFRTLIPMCLSAVQAKLSWWQGQCLQGILSVFVQILCLVCNNSHNTFVTFKEDLICPGISRLVTPGFHQTLRPFSLAGHGLMSKSWYFSLSAVLAVTSSSRQLMQITIPQRHSATLPSLRLPVLW